MTMDKTREDIEKLAIKCIFHRAVGRKEFLDALFWDYHVIKKDKCITIEGNVETVNKIKMQLGKYRIELYKILGNQGKKTVIVNPDK